MRRSLRTAWALLSVYYAYMLEYRAELLLWALSGSLPLILLGVWTQAAQSGQLGLSPVDFARYFLAVFIVRQFTVVWVIWEFEKEVHHVTSHLSERLARLPFVVGLILLFFALYPQAAWWPNFSSLLLFALVSAIAFALRFLIQYTFALFAFWTERASALEQFWFLLYLFLSGLIAPLEMFPPLMRQIVLWTPFPYFVYFPASVLVGLPVNWGQGLLVMLGWGALFWVLNRWLWRQGLKQYSGMGA
jgi:ABC-2 type transport system permease protein